MLYIVDRIENRMIVLENDDEQTFSVPQALIPEASEGDCIEISINAEETEKRRNNIRRLMEDLLQD